MDPSYTSPMEPKLLDLLDLTVSQSVLMLHQALEDHPGEALDVAIPPEEMLRDNLVRLLAQRGRQAGVHREQGWWRLEIAPTSLASLPTVIPLPPPPVLKPALRPALLLRESLGAGRSGQGRRLLLGVLRQLPEGTPWLVLALDGLHLLEDPEAVRVLEELQGRGIPVLLSRECALLTENDGFEIQEDLIWQRALAGGQVTVL